MKILCCQLEIVGVITRQAMQEHQARIESLIRHACGGHAVDMVLLPELSSIGYSQHAFENLTELASGIDEWLTRAMADFAREIDAAICFGLPRREENRLYISQVIVDRDGSLTGCYDKLHIAQFGASAEKSYFSPGNHITVVEACGFRLGVVICYDFRFGAYISNMVNEFRLDAMLHPVAFSRDGSFASWRSFVCARALENQIYWLSLNRAGQGWGHSLICPPWFESEDEVIEFGESEICRLITLDADRLKYARETYPLASDRLDDYSDIVKTGNKLGFE